MSDIFEKLIFPCSSPDEEWGVNTIVVGMNEQEYRAYPALAPSDLKHGIPMMKGHLRSKGSPARLKAHLQGLIPKKSSPVFELGTLYHKLVLESKGVTFLDEEKLEELNSIRMKRKVLELENTYKQKKFMCNFKEAKEFKEEHGRAPEPDEQPALIRARAEREAQDTSISEQSREMLDFRESQAQENNIVINTQNTFQAAAGSMYNALRYDPANLDVWNLIKEAPEDPRRVEVSVFCVVDVKVGESLFKVQLKGRIDWLPRYGSLDDLKTTKSIDTMDFTRDCFDMGYFISTAVYREMLNTLKGRVPEEIEEFYNLGKIKDVFYIAQETVAPHQAIRLQAQEAHVQAGWFFAKKALHDLCLAYGKSFSHPKAWRANSDEFVEDPFYPAELCHYIQDHANTITITRNN